MNEETVLKKSDLDGFTGTMEYHKVTMGNIKATDGVAYLAEKGKAFWLMDVIASYQIYPNIRNMDFQVWRLEVKNNKGKVMLLDEDKNVLKTQNIPYTDFSLPDIDIWLVNGVLLLPGEY